MTKISLGSSFVPAVALIALLSACSSSALIPGGSGGQAVLAGAAGVGAAGAGGQAARGGAAGVAPGGAGGQAANGGAAGISAAGAAGQAAGAAGSSAGQGGAGGQPSTTYAVMFPDIEVAAGVENTQCVVVSLGNTAPIHVGQIHTQVGASTVQMILYAVADTTEQITPFNCTPFTTLASPPAGTTALTIVQNQDETLTFPSGVGVALAANQMMRIELHYANSQTTSVAAQATSWLTTMPDVEFQSAASFLVIDDTQISVPPNGSAAIGPTYLALPAPVALALLFAVTSEQHRAGVSTQLWQATGANDPGFSLYMNTSWTTPPLTSLTPAVFSADFTGFKFACNWQNPTSVAISGGVDSTNELCMFVVYYYPATGPTLCVGSGTSFTCS